ncbi:hypothetical protein ACS5PN_16105 [Roseateles sp. NT4]|uniref:hypothetical protein n=1 Tax=Roseateles sp. NT4 TaxID=3453715 RepID=UPI003EEC9B94
MLRRLALVLMLLAGLALGPLARAAQPCCDQGGCDAMPACVAVCALCSASPAALPAPEPAQFTAVPALLGPMALAMAFDDWIDEIWTPPD